MQSRWNNVNREKLLPKNGNDFKCATDSGQIKGTGRILGHQKVTVGTNVDIKAKMLKNMLVHQIE